MSLLTQAEIAALHEALDDEYKAWTTYDQVIHDLGPERPFINIVESEARHIEALRALFERYGVAVPGNPWAGRVPRFASTREACQAGVEAEVENAAAMVACLGVNDAIKVAMIRWRVPAAAAADA